MPLDGFGAGGDRAWLEPVNDEGNRPWEEDADYGNVVGGHVGRHEWLNIYGAKPGYTYVWERRKTADIRSALMRGGTPVKDDDDEMAAGRAAAGGLDFNTSVDGMVEYRELQLVRYPEAAIRKIRAAEAKKAQESLVGGTDDFINSHQGAEQNDMVNPRGVRTRYATTEHRTEFRGSTRTRGDSINDQWTPDRGIIE